MSIYDKNLTDLPAIISSFAEIKNYHIEKSMYIDGFIIRVNNRKGKVVFGICREQQGCDGSDYATIFHSKEEYSGTTTPRLFESTDQSSFKLSLQFPSGDTFTLSNQHNGFYPRNCYLLFNDKKVVDDLLLI